MMPRYALSRKALFASDAQRADLRPKVAQDAKIALAKIQPIRGDPATLGSRQVDQRPYR